MSPENQILTLVARRGRNHSEASPLAALADRAPGRLGPAREADGRNWHVASVTIDPAGSADLVEYLDAASPNASADWSLTQGSPRRMRLLVSDMDSTIIGQECLDELADFAGLKAEVAAITERAMAGELDFEGALTTRVAMLKGLDLGALERCYVERITLNPGARTLIATMKANGAHCLLVSGGFTFFTSRVARAAGFDADRANTLGHDGASLTGEVGRPILGREAKLTALYEAADRFDATAADAIAMGDGANDLDMIRAAGLGVAYKAKPIVARETLARIAHTDLTAALFFQGYREDELVEVD